MLWSGPSGPSNMGSEREEKSGRKGGGASILILQSWESRVTSATVVEIGGAPAETRNSLRKFTHWEQGPKCSSERLQAE